MLKNKRAIIVLSIFGLFIIFSAFNLSNFILAFNGQLTPKSKQAMVEKLNIMQINEVVFSGKDLKYFNKQILNDDFKYENLAYYRFFSEKTNASTSRIIYKANQYAAQNMSLESIVKYYGENKENKREFKSVIENGRYNYKRAILEVSADRIDAILNRNIVLDRFFIPSDLIQLEKNIIPTYKNKDVSLKKSTHQALLKMCSALNEEFEKPCGGLIITKGYLDYAQVDKLFLKNKGKNNEFSISAGKNEHRLGSSIDIKLKNKSKKKYLKSKQYKWLKENAANYGFIFRYLDGKQSKTNKIPSSPYHLRYVGEKLALKLSQDNLSLEEYYKITYFDKEVKQNER